MVCPYRERVRLPGPDGERQGADPPCAVIHPSTAVGPLLLERPHVIVLLTVQPGGQDSLRPARTWKWRWWTLWPACAPMLDTTR